MGFSLTEEQKDFRELAHTFAEREMRPVAPEFDEKEEMAWEVIKKAAKTGLLSFRYPEEYGGAGITSLLTDCIVMEELAWGCAGITTAASGGSLAGLPILLGGTEAQKMKYLSTLCASDKLTIAGMCLTEPAAGSDASSMKTNAKREGDYYLLNGRKCFITNGGISDWYTVFASTDKSKGLNGISCFVVEAGWPGVSAGKKELKMGIRSSHTGDVVFDDVRVPVENLVGSENRGFSLCMRMLDWSRPMVASMAVGVARAALEFAIQYSKQRVQFGKPIAKLQAISSMLADMATAVDAARMLVWRAAWLADNGQPFAKESAMAKCYAGDTAMKVTTDAVQVLGGYGYMREYPVEKWMRDAKIMQIYEGTAQIQREVIGTHLRASKRTMFDY
ncbi:MAG: acyl-CoA dehydrogenase family protein [Chloroflexi bacterium]|nr:acyl-CoA dehydrogenase family protein [Chloroflexota bacterium]